jgi:hypothetical protein
MPPGKAHDHRADDNGRDDATDARSTTMVDGNDRSTPDAVRQPSPGTGATGDAEPGAYRDPGEPDIAGEHEPSATDPADMSDTDPADDSGAADPTQA